MCHFHLVILEQILTVERPAVPGRYQRREKPDDDSADEHEQNACDLSNHLFIISLTERQPCASECPQGTR
jgi:hypothetical protein